MSRLSSAIVGVSLFFVSISGSHADTDSSWAAYRAGKHQQAFKELEALSKTGNAEAFYLRGTVYADGLAVRRDYRKAAEYCRLAAEKGHTRSQFFLGFLYLTGAGEGDSAVPSNPELSAQWLKAAAEANNPDAQQCLGRMYLEGRGVAADSAAALRWSLPAAERTLAAAQYDVGLVKSRSPVFGERLEGYAWFLLADRQGYPGARENLALLTPHFHPLELARAAAAVKAWAPGMRLVVPAG